MWDQVVPILLGFVLTTVIGGIFASLLQQRSWRNQNRVRLHEENRRRASDVCHSLSGLVDKRSYRMQRLLWAVVAHAEGRLPADVLDSRRRDYDQVLLEWNDELNARLAIVGASFGGDVRDFLDEVVYEAFKDAGQQLEGLYRQVAGDQPAHLEDDAVARVTDKIGRLNNLAYTLSFTMMVRLRDGKFGPKAPKVLGDVALRDTITP